MERPGGLFSTMHHGLPFSRSLLLGVCNSLGIKYIEIRRGENAVQRVGDIFKKLSTTNLHESEEVTEIPARLIRAKIVLVMMR